LIPIVVVLTVWEREAFCVCAHQVKVLAAAHAFREGGWKPKKILDNVATNLGDKGDVVG